MKNYPQQFKTTTEVNKNFIVFFLSNDPAEGRKPKPITNSDSNLSIAN